MPSTSERKMDKAIRTAQDMTPKERAVKLQERQQSGRREDKELVAILYSTWEAVAVAVPDDLCCTKCAGKRACRRATVAGSLETIDVNGEKVFLRGLLWPCLACLRRSQTCQVVFKDDQGHETTLTYQGLTKTVPPFPVQGFVLEGKPRRDAPEHNVPFLGKSKDDAFNYIQRMRDEIINEALDAVPRESTDHPRTNAERALFIRETRDTLRKMEDSLDDLSFKVHDYLDIIKKHRADDAFNSVCVRAKMKLFKGLIQLCEAHPDVTFDDLSDGSGERLVLIRVHLGAEEDAIDGARKGIEEGYKRMYPFDDSDEVMVVE